MKDNICNYSDNWQKYVGDYDKYEYDIVTTSGLMILNCYPNAGIFHSFTSRVFVSEELVACIRFSLLPSTSINYRVSENRMIEGSNNYQCYDQSAMHSYHNIAQLPGMYLDSYPESKNFRGTYHPVRTGVKINRNEPCPCGSGKKNKKCCNK